MARSLSWAEQPSPTPLSAPRIRASGLEMALPHLSKFWDKPNLSKELKARKTARRKKDSPEQGYSREPWKELKGGRKVLGDQGQRWSQQKSHKSI